MATKKQIDANRRNSEKSTGPKTEEGKQKSSQNALKHGMYAEDILLFHEDFEGYETFRSQLFRDQEPKCVAEFFLLEQLLQSYFMSRRALFMMADADNSAIHGGKATVYTYPAIMKMKLQNDRIVQKSIQMLEEFKAKKAKAKAAKPINPADPPEVGFVPPIYPDARPSAREIPYNLR